jgi:hypothetical protein
MDIDLSPGQAAQALVYLSEMAAAVEGVDRSVDPEERRSYWVTYCEKQGELHRLIPVAGETPADEGPYTPEY